MENSDYRYFLFYYEISDNCDIILKIIIIIGGNYVPGFLFMETSDLTDRRV